MKTDLLSVLEAACVAGAISLVGCGSDMAKSPGEEAGCPGKGAGCPAVDAGCPGKGAGCPAVDAGCPGKDAGCPATAGTDADAQTPPTGDETAMSAWLAEGDYNAWACESAPHAARSPSPHGINRICSNDALSTHGKGEYPVGAAGVKELYDAAGKKIVGHAVYLKVTKGKGEAWYWFEKTDANGLIANGLGDSGTPKTVCVGCHAGTGSDADHAGHDFVYTQVK